MREFWCWSRRGMYLYAALHLLQGVFPGPGGMLMDFVRRAVDGNGVVNLLDEDKAVRSLFTQSHQAQIYSLKNFLGFP